MPCTMNWYLFAKYSKSNEYLQQSTVISHIGKIFGDLLPTFSINSLSDLTYEQQ